MFKQPSKQVTRFDREESLGGCRTILTLNHIVMNYELSATPSVCSSLVHAGHDVEAITGRCGLLHMSWTVGTRLPLVVLVAQALYESILVTGQKGDLATFASRVSIGQLFQTFDFIRFRLPLVLREVNNLAW